MLRFVPKTVKYYASAATALWGARAAVGLEVGMTVAGVACLALIPLVFAFVKIEDKFRDGEEPSKKAKDDDSGGMLLSLAEGLRKARFADPDDEAIAEQANKLVRQELDKRCISYRKYKEIRQKNPLVFTAVVSEDNELIGFFDIFPLNDQAAAAVLSGQKRDADIGIDDIVPATENAEVAHLYVATILHNPKQTTCSTKVGQEIVCLKLYEYLLTQFAPIKQRTLLAYAHTTRGQCLLEKARFTVRLTAKDTVQRRPLFVLDASRADAVRDRYEGICAALAALEGRKLTAAAAA